MYELKTTQEQLQSEWDQEALTSDSLPSDFRILENICIQRTYPKSGSAHTCHLVVFESIFSSTHFSSLMAHLTVHPGGLHSISHSTFT